MTPSAKNISPAFLFTLSFIEGGCVMATEITGARVLAPLFGGSLYVWSAVLAITLSGLAFGYFVGGRLTSKPNREKRLLYILVFAAIFMMCMPVTGKFMKLIAFHLPLLPAVSISALLVLFPPLMFMGMVSPLIISLLITEKKGGGSRAGEVYALSTGGGIIFTFLTGFWLLPMLGNEKLMLILGALLIALPLMLLVRMRFTFQSLIFFFFASFVAYTVWTNLRSLKNVLYASDGIFGRVEVIDFEQNDPETGRKKHPRYLLVNNIIQSAIDLETKDYMMDYTGEIDSNITLNGKGRKVLVLGLGGGVVANIFAAKDYDVTAIELDRRNYEAAKNYFFLHENVNVVIDDARNYVNRMTGKYDVIMIDVFKGEDPPYYVLTSESISKMKRSLNAGGMIIVNTYGFLDPQKGKGNRALIATFQNAGFAIRLVSTGTSVDNRNILIYASQDFSKEKNFAELAVPDVSEAIILTDNNCPLDHLNAEAGMQWRQLYLKNFILPKQD